MKKKLCLCVIKNIKFEEKNILLLPGSDNFYQLKNKEVANYYLDHKNKYDFFLKIRQIKKIFFKHISSQLNELHNVSYSSRFWDILIGSWMEHFIELAYDRISIIEFVLKKYDIDKIYLYKDNNITPNTTAHFLNNHISDKFNFDIFGDILRNINNLNIIEIDNNKNDNYDEFDKSAYNENLKEDYKIKFLKFLDLLKNKNSKYFIQNSYLNKLEETILKLSLNSFSLNKNVSQINLIQNNVKRDLRNKIKFDKIKNNKLKILFNLIKKYFPKSFIENFHLFQNEIQQSPLPYKPKVIFTSNLHYFDDYFCHYAARKIEDGAKLFIGQHGGMFGSAKLLDIENRDIRIADKYFNWGWDKSSKGIPLGLLKNDITLSLKLKRLFNKKNKILIISCKYPSYFSRCVTKPISRKDWNIFFNHQQTFINNLNIPTKSNIIFRDKSIEKKPNESYTLFKNNNKNITFSDASKKRLIIELKDARIAVVNYNATVLIQLLSANIPTVAFWDNNQWELRDQAIPYYNELINCEILFFDPKLAAQKINKVWDPDILHEWWYNEKTTKAIKKFLDMYGKKISSLEKIKKIRNFLKK